MALTYPDDCLYSDSHEYVRREGDLARLGISAFAVDQLGDIVFVELPKVGDTIALDTSFGTVESVKAVEMLYAPISGVVEARNEAVVDTPEVVQADPYGEGWLLLVRPSNADELANLMTAAAYREIVKGD